MRKSSSVEIITPESRQVIEEILDILSEPSISLTYFQRSAHSDTDLKLAKIVAGMYNEHCWSRGESISLHLLQTEISDLQIYLSTKKELLSNAQYIFALEKYDITNKPQSNKIYEIIVSLQQISGPGIDESNLIDLLIYFAVRVP